MAQSVCSTGPAASPWPSERLQDKRTRSVGRGWPWGLGVTEASKTTHCMARLSSSCADFKKNAGRGGGKIHP